MLSGSPSPNVLLFDCFGPTDATNAGVPLLVSGECIHTGEAVTTFTRVWLDSCVYLLMTFQVVLAHKALITMYTEELTVS